MAWKAKEHLYPHIHTCVNGTIKDAQTWLKFIKCLNKKKISKSGMIWTLCVYVTVFFTFLYGWTSKNISWTTHNAALKLMYEF